MEMLGQMSIRGRSRVSCRGFKTECLCVFYNNCHLSLFCGHSCCFSLVHDYVSNNILCSFVSWQRLWSKYLLVSMCLSHASFFLVILCVHFLLDRTTTTYDEIIHFIFTGLWIGQVGPPNNPSFYLSPFIHYFIHTSLCRLTLYNN